MKKPPFSWLIALAIGLSPAVAETVKDREGAVRQDKARMEEDSRWIYNDVDKGFAEATRTGKPLLVALRCVPCMSCMGIDQSILQSTDLAPMLDQFVCVRIINANTLDLSRFQFDYDLSFSTLFFNGDGTVYGRHGSWTHQKDSSLSTTEGYQAALKAAQAIHAGYPGNKALLAGKQGGPTPFKMPVEIPALAERYGRELDWQGNVVKSCVHCHQIGDAFRASYRDKGQLMPLELIYPMPMPETVGLSLETSHIARVSAVIPGSAAAKAGLRVGDDIAQFGGQPLVSIADFAWVLHRAGESADLAMAVSRQGKELPPLTLNLENGWRLNSDISKRVGTWPMRAMATGGLKMVDLTDEERAARKLSVDQLALNLEGVGQWGAHGAAKNAGFQKGDVLIEVNGMTERLTESQFIGRVLRENPGKTKLPAVVLRGDQRVELMLPVQ